MLHVHLDGCNTAVSSEVPTTDRSPHLPSQCSLANPCAPGVKCIDKEFGYMCEDCPAGYTSKYSEGLDLDDALKAKQVCSL